VPINLIHGDCLEKMCDIPDGSVDLVLTDPPYGTTACKWDSVIPLEPMWEQLKRIAKPNAAIVMTASQPFTTKLISSNYGMFKYESVWAKNTATGALNAKKQPMRSHENIIVFYRNQPTYNPIYRKRTKKELRRFMKCPTETVGTKVYKTKSRVLLGRDAVKKAPNTLLLFNAVHGRDAAKVPHPTQKPVSLMEYLVLTYTDPGDTVLDFTMGSGTTGVACVQTERDFIGIERDAEYFKIAEKRIADAIRAGVQQELC